MKFLVTWEVFEGLTQADLRDIRHNFGPGFQKLAGSPQVTDAGVFADARAGYFIMDIERPEQMTELLGPEILDNCHVESHPFYSIDAISRLFEQWHEQGR